MANMALQPLERHLPVGRSNYSFFQPTWEVGPWQDFNANFRQMQMQMKQMERQMEEMFRRFQRLQPAHPALPAPSQGGAAGAGRVQEWRLPNPISTTPDGRRQFQLQFDVRQFRPEEVSVKTYDNLLVVHANHKESSPNSKVVREFKREFLLPQGVRPDILKSTLSPEGVLTIEAPMAALEGPPQERLIPIQQH